MGIVYTWPSAEGSGTIPTYPTFSAFPPTAADGSLALALDTDNLYAFNGTSMMWVLIASPSSTVNYAVNRFTLTPTDITNKFVTLTSAPTLSTSTVLNIIGGVVQDYGTDFSVSGSQLSWSGLFLDGVLIAGDKLIVQFI